MQMKIGAINRARTFGSGSSAGGGTTTGSNTSFARKSVDRFWIRASPLYKNMRNFVAVQSIDIAIASQPLSVLIQPSRFRSNHCAAIGRLACLSQEVEVAFSVVEQEDAGSSTGR